MNVEIIKKSIEHPAILQCWIGARYWEDSYFNGEEDTGNADFLKTNFPKNFFLNYNEDVDVPVKNYMKKYKQDFLYLEIDLETGTIHNWPKEITAEFGYKSCDMNFFNLLDEGQQTIAHTKDGWTDYVIGPSFMNEYGDYFVLQVDKNGNIIGWDSEEMENSLQQWIDSLNNE